MHKNISEEKIRILKRVEERKISTEEAMKLLDASEEKTTPKKGAKWLKVRVRTMDDKPKVNVNIPLSLARVGLKLSKTFNPKLKESSLDQLNVDDIINHVKDGADGKIVDVEDEENQTKVKVYVE